MSNPPETSRPWLAWRAHFEQQRRRPLPAVPSAVAPFAGASALARSLARFQLGESGEGRVAHQIASVTIEGLDADYVRALQLFVTEEGRHGRVLGGLVRALGGPLLVRHWSDVLFTALRRVLRRPSPLGVRFKLLVLLTAEIVGLAFYRSITPALPLGELRRALREICRDESAHLRFHAAFFARTSRSSFERGIWAWLLIPVTAAAAAVVLLDHGPALARHPGGRWALLRSLARLLGMARALSLIGPSYERDRTKVLAALPWPRHLLVARECTRSPSAPKGQGTHVLRIQVPLPP